jgi:hypothetical protein
MNGPSWPVAEGERRAGDGARCAQAQRGSLGQGRDGAVTAAALIAAPEGQAPGPACGGLLGSGSARSWFYKHKSSKLPARAARRAALAPSNRLNQRVASFTCTHGYCLSRTAAGIGMCGNWMETPSRLTAKARFPASEDAGGSPRDVSSPARQGSCGCVGRQLPQSDLSGDREANDEASGCG